MFVCLTNYVLKSEPYECSRGCKEARYMEELWKRTTGLKLQDFYDSYFIIAVDETKP